MPHKLNAARRDKFPVAKYRVTNWSEGIANLFDSLKLAMRAA